MAKISRAQGPSIEEEPRRKRERQPVQHLLSRRPVLGGALLVGSNSSPSTVRPQRTDDKENPSLPQPAQTTESPLGADRKEAILSTVPLTGGSGQTTQNQPSAETVSNVDSPKKTSRTARKAAAKKTAPKETRTRVVDELADDEDDF